jgi:nucleoside-diphosphate-sugar epimerase
MKVLVTGGGGFVGFAVVNMLLARGDRVRTVSRGAYPKLAAIGAEHMRADLSDKKSVLTAVNGVDAVIHVAAKAGVWGSAADYQASNIDATQNVIDACVDRGVASLVMTSSPSVTFGGGDAKNADESLPYPQKHLHHYGRTKAEAERRVLAANGTPHKRGTTVLLTCAVRPHLVFGEGDPHILPRLVTRAKAGRLMWIGDKSSLIDVTYVDNAAHAHLLALDGLLHHQHKPAGKAFFISQGTPVSPERWVNAILEAVGIAPIKKRVPLALAYGIGAAMELAWRALPLKGEPLMTRFLAAQLGTSHYYDLAAARRDLGYEPIVDDAAALQRTVGWLKGELEEGRL